MKVLQNKIDDLNLELTVEIEAADYAEIERKKLAERKRNADFKGFRKGMVPLTMIKRVYGEQCLAEAVNQVISEALDKHISENKLHILGEPLSSEKQPEIEWVDGNGFTFIFDVALSPEVNFEVEKKDTVPSYNVTVSADEKNKMTESLKKYYEEKKEEKSDEDIAKEVDERLSSQYKNEAEWRLNKDIREYFVNKAGLELPEAFLKRWLVVANGGKITAEDVEKDFPGFAADFKWQLVYQYAMYGIADVPKEIVDEAVVNMLHDRRQIDRLAEQVEDRKVIEKLKSEITLKATKITSAKFRELK